MGRKRKFSKEEEIEIERQYNPENKEDRVSSLVLGRRWGCDAQTICNIVNRISKMRTKKVAMNTESCIELQKQNNSCVRGERIGEKNPNYRNHKLAGENNPNYKGGKPKCLDCGKEISYIAKRCNSCANKGNKNAAGCKRSEEEKKRIGDKNRNNPACAFWLNKKRSEETKQKHREKALQRIQNHFGPFKDTKPELKMKEILNELNIQFEHQFRIEGINHNFDFRILNTNILIEVDGDYFHGNPKKYSTLYERQIKQRQKDKENEELAKASNFILLRFWEDDILNNTEEIKMKLYNLIGGENYEREF